MKVLTLQQRVWAIRLGLLGLVLTAMLIGAPYAPNIAADLGAAIDNAKRSFGLVVQTVDVEGAIHTPDAALNEAIGDLRGRLLDDIALDSLKARVEAISWVKSADVKRHLPDRVLIRLTERTPFALWQVDGVLGLVDKGGVLLTHDDLARWRDLPLLVGEGAPEHAEDILAIVGSEPEFSDMVEALIRVGDRRWDIRMHNNILLRLPSGHDASDWTPDMAWQRFSALERQYSLLSRDIAIIDLRLKDRLAVRLTPNGKALGLAKGQSI